MELYKETYKPLLILLNPKLLWPRDRTKESAFEPLEELGKTLWTKEGHRGFPAFFWRPLVQGLVFAFLFSPLLFLTWGFLNLAGGYFPLISWWGY